MRLNRLAPFPLTALAPPASRSRVAAASPISILAVLALLALIAHPSRVQARAPFPGVPDNVTRAFQKSTVHVAAFGADRSHSHAMGFSALDRSCIVTAWHVVKDASSITVTDGSGKRQAGLGVVDYNAASDIALVRLTEPLDALLPMAKRSPRHGDPVFAHEMVDNEAVPRAFTTLSATNREGERRTLVAPMFTAGASGGPVVNAAGEVVGLVSVRWEGVDVGVMPRVEEIRQLDPGKATVAFTETSLAWHRYLASGSFEATIERADDEAQHGHGAEAMRLYAEARRLRPDSRLARLGRADMLRGGHRFAAALPLFEEILREEPNALDALSGRAYCLVALKRAEEAELALTAVLLAQPRSGDFYGMRADIKKARGDAEGALDDYRQASRWSRYQADHWRRTAAYLAVEVDRLSEAVTDLELENHNAALLCLRGSCRLALGGQDSHAVEDFTGALVHQPQMALARMNRAMAYLRLGDSARYWEDMRAAAEADPTTIVALLFFSQPGGGISPAYALKQVAQDS